MGRVRLHGLRCLLYALCVLALSPVVVEFAFRLNAFRATRSPVDELQPTVVFSPVTHHQLAPLQQLKLPTVDGTDEVDFRTNSRGWRGLEVATPKPAGVFRIVCVGDETVLAANLPESLTFPQRLAERLQPYTQARLEVINAAVPGYSPVLAALQARHQLQLLNADLIVAHFDVSDPVENRRHLRFTDLAADDTPLVCVHPQLAARPKLKSACEHFLCVNWLNQQFSSWLHQQEDRHESDCSPLGLNQWLKDPAFAQPDELKTALLPFDQLAATVERSGTRVMLVVHPWVDHLLTRDAATENSAASKPLPFSPVFTQFEQSTGIPVCHMQPYLKRLPEPEKAFQADRRLLTQQGHDIYSYGIAATILQRVPGPWILPSRSETSPQVTDARHAEPVEDRAGVVRANRQGAQSTGFITRPIEKP